MTKRLFYPFIFAFFIISIVQTACAQPMTDFTEVAEKTIPAVVSVRTTFKRSQSSSGKVFESFGGFEDRFLERFFGFQRGEGAESSPLPKSQGQASGFIISPDGYVLTNGHVVRDGDLIEVQLEDGRQFEASLIGIDPNTDIALVKIDAKNLPYLEFADSSKLKVGQWVIAVGNPLGLQTSLTVGVVSGVGRNNLDLAALENFIQTDAAINRGNSGGPLLNARGEVVGMNTAIASGSGGNIGIGFAIPSNLLSFVVDQLRNNGNVTRGYIGVVIQPIDYDLAKALGLDRVEGALVSEIQEDSPAGKAGLKRGDIILKVNGKAVDNPGALRNAVSTMKPGAKIALQVMREKKQINLTLEVGSHPDNDPVDEETGIKHGFGKNALGVTVKELTQEASERLGYIGEEGVVIEDFDPQGPAAFAGLKKGTLVLEVNQEPVKTKAQFNKLVSSLEKGGRVLLLIRQGGMTRYVALTIR